MGGPDLSAVRDLEPRLCLTTSSRGGPRRPLFEFEFSWVSLKNFLARSGFSGAHGMNPGGLEDPRSRLRLCPEELVGVIEVSLAETFSVPELWLASRLRKSFPLEPWGLVSVK